MQSSHLAREFSFDELQLLREIEQSAKPLFEVFKSFKAVLTTANEMYKNLDFPHG